MQIKNAKFVISNTDFNKCPQSDFPEYAFIGRSNIGKSSLINMLVDRKNLAKTSGTPGKTQLINHFIINNAWHIVDLPGYGYAKTSKKNRQSWEGMISNYLLNRENLVATFVLIDSRHEPQKIDLEFISWLGEKEIQFFLVFTKIDKLTKTRLARNIKAYREFLVEQWEELPISILTSAKTQTGKKEILDLIESLNEESKT